MSGEAGAVRAEETRRIRRLLRRALIEERRPLVALFFLLFFSRVVDCAVTARLSPPRRERSPFIYDMR